MHRDEESLHLKEIHHLKERICCLESELQRMEQPDCSRCQEWSRSLEEIKARHQKGKAIDSYFI